MNHEPPKGLSSEDMLPREEREKQQEVVRKAFDLQRLDHDKAPQVSKGWRSMRRERVCVYCTVRHTVTLTPSP